MQPSHLQNDSRRGETKAAEVKRKQQR
jgi:hypothetical protein